MYVRTVHLTLYTAAHTSLYLQVCNGHIWISVFDCQTLYTYHLQGHYKWRRKRTRKKARTTIVYMLCEFVTTCNLVAKFARQIAMEKEQRHIYSNGNRMSQTIAYILEPVFSLFFIRWLYHFGCTGTVLVVVYLPQHFQFYFIFFFHK